MAPNEGVSPYPVGQGHALVVEPLYDCVSGGPVRPALDVVQDSSGPIHKGWWALMWPVMEAFSSRCKLWIMSTRYLRIRWKSRPICG